MNIKMKKKSVLMITLFLWSELSISNTYPSPKDWNGYVEVEENRGKEIQNEDFEQNWGLPDAGLSENKEDKVEKKKDPQPISFYYADNFPIEFLTLNSVLHKRIKEDLELLLHKSSVDFKENGFNVKNITKNTTQALNVFNGSFSSIFSKMKNDDVYEMRFGITRMMTPEKDMFQYGQIGSGSEKRFARIFQPFTKEFEGVVAKATKEMIVSENDYFDSQPSIYGEINSEAWAKLKRQNYEKEYPYFLGLFFKVLIKKDKRTVQSQVAIGLRPLNLSFSEISDLVEITNFIIPNPTKKNGVEYAPIALVHTEVDSEMINNLKEAKVPLQIELGSFGHIENGFIETRKDSIFKRIWAGVNQIIDINDDGAQRISDTLPYLKGQALSSPSIKVDININKLNFIVQPEKLQEELPVENIDLKEFINLKGTGLKNKVLALIEGFSGLNKKEKEKFKNEQIQGVSVQKQDFIHLKSSSLIISVGYDSKIRILPLPGTIGGANKSFTESVNENIDKNMMLLKTESGQAIVNMIIPNFFKYVEGK